MSQNNILETFLDNVPNIRSKFDIGATPLAILPQNTKVENLEKFLDAPVAIKETVKFQDMRGFVQYINDFKTESTVVFIGEKGAKAIFDYHQKDVPAWGRHIAEYDFKFTTSYQRWLSKNDQQMHQRNFAEFLEDQLQDITSPPAGDLLQIIKAFKTTRNTKIESKVDHTGTNFMIEQEIRGGSKENFTMPEKMQVVFDVFKNVSSFNISGGKTLFPSYAANLRLYFYTPEGGSLSFKYSSNDFEIIREKAMEDMFDAVKELTDVTVYIG